MKKLFDAYRLTIVFWCFCIILKITPKNTEGLIVINVIKEYAVKTVEYHKKKEVIN